MIDTRGNVTSKIIDISSQSDYHQDSIKYKENSIYTIQGYNDFSFVPDKNLNNCGEIRFRNIISTISYTVEFDITWKNFTDLPSNFSCWLQGAQYNDNTKLWQWDYSSCLTVGYGINIQNLILTSTSGKVHVRYTTKDPLKDSHYSGFGIGIRVNYSNGIGEVGFHNITVVPTKYKPKNTNVSIFENTIVLDNFMEV